MAMFLVRRLGLMLLTLWILSVIVFLAGQVLPGDPGRAILGNLASASAVKALDDQLGVGRPLDRVISVVGLSAATVPEFVSGIVVIVIFSTGLRWLPSSASAGPGAGDLTQFRHLILPAIPLVLVLFGYIARMARAGTIDALAADYTRTAVLKGLPQATVLTRHVLRNSLLPTITVVATQTGYLIGGLVVTETLFNYQGIGQLIYKAAQAKDFPMLEAGVLTIGVVYTLATLAADLLLIALSPRLRAAAIGSRAARAAGATA